MSIYHYLLYLEIYYSYFLKSIIPVIVKAKSNDLYILKWLNNLIQASLNSQRRLSNRIIIYLYTAIAIIVSISDNRHSLAYRNILSLTSSYIPLALIDLYL